MKRIIFLNLLLILAGIAHLMDPYAFSNSIPEFVPNKYLIIISTGILQMLLGLALVFKKTRSLAAKTLAVYFTLLIPIHIYTSIYQIPMMGFSDPVILWIRTFLQLPLIYLTLSLRKA